MGQIRTRNVSLNSVIRSPAFRQGVSDYLTGRPGDFDRDWPADARKSPTDKAWSYERGRHFAAWAAGQGVATMPKFFIDRRVNPAISKLVRDAYFSGAIR